MAEHRVNTLVNLFAITIAGLATFSASAPHRSAPGATRTAWEIKPGVSVGKVHLGEHIEAVRSILGKEDLKSPHADAAMGHFWEVWPGKQGHELDIYSVRGPNDSAAHPDVKVRQIRTTSSSFHTAGGVCVGSPESLIRRKIPGLAVVMGTPQMRLLDSRKLGIAIEIKGGHCTAITVHPKGEAVTSEYLPHPDYGH